MADRRTTVPYACLYIDASWFDVMAALSMTIGSYQYDRDDVKQKLKKIFQEEHNKNHVIPCLSVRSGFDLYLRAKNYPVGSEVIMTAINIPSMSEIVKHHGLNVVPWDINVDTLLPNVDTIKEILTDRTVAIVVAHIYGKNSKIHDLIFVAKQHNLDVIEDCAESFSGLDNLGNQGADISLFSFGIIKHSTAFGGSLAKVRDTTLANTMDSLHERYPLQSASQYLKNVLKYTLLMTLVNIPCITKYGSSAASKLNIDYKEMFVRNLRTFPSDLIEKIRQRPSTPLMCMMYRRLKQFDPESFDEGMKKYEYVSAKLPSRNMLVGSKCTSNNYWLFPIIVKDPTKFIKLLSSMGVEAYSGATQLSLVQATSKSTTAPYPHQAHDIMQKVVYLPVHKYVPFHHLDNICSALKTAMEVLASVEGNNADLSSKL